MPAGVETGISQNSNSHFCSNRHRVYGDASIIPVLLKNFLRFGSRHFSTSFAYSASRPVFSLPECPDLAMKSSSPHRFRRLNPAARSGLSSERPFLLRESLRRCGPAARDRGLASCRGAESPALEHVQRMGRSRGAPRDAVSACLLRVFTPTLVNPGRSSRPLLNPPIHGACS